MPFWIVFNAMSQPPLEARWRRLGPQQTMTYALGGTHATGSDGTPFRTQAAAETWLAEHAHLWLLHHLDEPWHVVRVVEAESVQDAITRVHHDPALRAARRAGWAVADESYEPTHPLERLRVILREPSAEKRAIWAAVFQGNESVRVADPGDPYLRARTDVDAVLVGHRAFGEDYGHGGTQWRPYGVADSRQHGRYATPCKAPWVVGWPPLPGAECPVIAEIFADTCRNLFARIRAFNEAGIASPIKALGIYCPTIAYGLAPGLALQQIAEVFRRTYDAAYRAQPQSA